MSYRTKRVKLSEFKIQSSEENLARLKETGFIVENPGKSYQVNDRLVFDDTDTGGSGASAEISTIRGKAISSYSFETINDRPYGVITTSDPHEIQIGDKVQVAYNAQLDDSNKLLKVKVIDGIESLTVTQIGTGYNDDVPIEVQIDGDGIDAETIVTSAATKAVPGITVAENFVS